MTDDIIDNIIHAILDGRREKILRGNRSELDEEHFKGAGISLLKHFYQNNPKRDAEIIDIASQILDE